MQEQEMYEPIRKWLRAQGYRAIITHGRKDVIIGVGDIFPTKTYIEPDVVGITTSWTENVCIEAKAEIKEIFEIVGKCMTWQLAAHSVYLAVPEQTGFKTDGLKSLGVGLLFVSGGVREVIKPRYHGWSDNSKSQELFNQAFRAIKSEYAVIETSSPRVTSNPNDWNIMVKVRNIGSQTVQIYHILLNKDSYLNLKCTIAPKAPSGDHPIKISPDAEYELTITIPKSDKLQDRSLQLDFTVSDGIERGSSVYLPTQTT